MSSHERHGIEDCVTAEERVTLASRGRSHSLKRRREDPTTVFAHGRPIMGNTSYALGGHLDAPGDLRSILGTMMYDTELKELCDVVLDVGGEKFPAHRAVLAASSPVFRAMFTSEMKEKKATEIKLESIEPRSWRMALQFIYTAQIDIQDADTALLLLGSARMYQLDTLEKFIETFLISRLTVGNCFVLYSHAEHFDLSELRESCQKTMEERFEEMVLSPAFLECPISLLTRLLKSGNLVIRSETTVLDAVTRWVDSDEPKRSSNLEKLLQMVRLSEMSESELAVVGRGQFAEKSIAFRSALLDTLLRRREDSEGIGRLLATGSHLKARKRRDKPFTFAHLLRGVQGNNNGEDEEIVRTPWSPDSTGKHVWRLKIYPKGYLKAKGEYLSMYVQGKSLYKRDELDVQARFDIFLVNRNDPSGTMSFSSQHHFTAASDHWGFHRFCPLGRLLDPEDGFISNETDAVVVGANVML